MQIRDPDTLLAIIAQLKSQFGHQLAELHDALAVANVKNVALEAENLDFAKRLKLSE